MNSNRHAAKMLGVSEAMVGKLRNRFVEQRLDGLVDKERPGAPRTIREDNVEAVIVKTLEEEPIGATHWSTRSMASATGMSQTAVSRIWRAFGLQPHQGEDTKPPADLPSRTGPKMSSGSTFDPPERVAVVCLDEASQIQAPNRSAPLLAIMPCTPERGVHDNLRPNPTSLFAALEVAAGTVSGSVPTRHRASQFKRFLARIDEETPAHLDVHLVLDSRATTEEAEIHTWLLRHPRFHPHFTRTSGSWLNLVQRWFAERTTNKAKRGLAYRHPIARRTTYQGNEQLNT